MQAPSLFFTEEDLERARKRIASKSEPWKSIVEEFFASAAQIASASQELPDFDSSWYDNYPEKDFLETYNEYHCYIFPARQLAEKAQTLARAAVLGCKNSQQYKALAIKFTQHVLDNLKVHVMHCDSGMNYRHTMRAIADVYFLLSEDLPDSWQQSFLAFTPKAAQAIIDCNQYWQNHLDYMPYNNHLAFHRDGMLICGICLNDNELIEKAFNGPGSPEHMLAGCVTDDGLCYESSTLYHYATFGAMNSFALTTRAIRPLGRNVYDEIYADGRSLKQMLDAPLAMLMPDGQRPSFGDCYCRRPKFLAPQKPNYELGYSIWKDPHYAWVINKTEGRGGVNALLYGQDKIPAGIQPEVGSRIWIEHGWAIASSRNNENYFDENSSGFTAAINGDKSCVHHHRDKFTMQLAAGKDMWLVDAECDSTMINGFSDPVKEQFCRSGWAHNTIIVNGAEQNELIRPLNFIRYRHADGECSVSLADFDSRVYDNTQMIRTMVTANDYCLDVFDIQSENAQTMDWLIHPDSESSSFDAEMAACDKPDNCPCPVLNDFKCNDIAGTSLSGSFKSNYGELAIEMQLLTDSDTNSADKLEMYYATWPTITDDSTPRRPMYFVRVNNSDKTCFACLYQLSGSDRCWTISSAERKFNGSENELRVTLKCGSEEKHYVLPGV